MQIIREKETKIKKTEKLNEEKESNIKREYEEDSGYTENSECREGSLVFETKKEAEKALVELISDMKSVAISDEISRRKDPKCKICKEIPLETSHFEECFLIWARENFDLKSEIFEFLENSKLSMGLENERPKLGGAATRMIAASLHPRLGKLLRKKAKNAAKPRKFGFRIENEKRADFSSFLTTLKSKIDENFEIDSKLQISQRIKSVGKKEICGLDYLSAYDYVNCVTFENKI